MWVVFDGFGAFLPVLGSVGLFQGIGAFELEAVLGCVCAEVRVVNKGDIFLLAGDMPRQVGVVLRGQLHIVREDYDGNRSLIAILTPGSVFAEALCCAGVPESPVTVIADLDSVVISIDFERILHVCSNSCSHHRELIKNMLRLIAGKNLMLQSHMEILSLRSIRARVLRYFESFKPKPGREFAIPLNREELANYLCVERSALSHELGKMKKDGLIDYKKNRFVINTP